MWWLLGSEWCNVEPMVLTILLKTANTTQTPAPHAISSNAPSANPAFFSCHPFKPAPLFSLLPQEPTAITAQHLNAPPAVSHASPPNFAKHVPKALPCLQTTVLPVQQTAGPAWLQASKIAHHALTGFLWKLANVYRAKIQTA